MHTRIQQIISTLGITKTEFARRLNLSQPYVSELCQGVKAKPSDRTISNICREFGVNEIWLRTGIGEMFRQMTRGEEIMAFIGSSLSRGEDDIRVRMVAALAKLQPEQWDALEVVVDGLLAAIPGKPKTEKG